MAGYQDPVTQNANAWLALAKGIGTTAADNFQQEKNFYGNVLSRIPSPAQNIRRDFEYGTLPNGHIPTSPVHLAPDGTRMSEPIPLDQLAQMGDQPPPPRSLPLPATPLVLRPDANGDLPSGNPFALPSSPTPGPAGLGGGGGGLGGNTGSSPSKREVAAAYGLSLDTKKSEELFGQLQSKAQQLADEQRKHQEALKGGLSGLLGQDLQYDLTPLAALVDQWSGSNLARSYQRPESVQDRRKAIGQAEQGIYNAGLDATKTEMGAASQAAGHQFDTEKLRYGVSKDNAELGLKRQQLGLEADRNNIERMKASMKPGPEIKDTQWQAGLYGKRMQDANAIMEDLYSKPGVLKYAIGNGGAIDRHLPTTFQNPATKQITQAERNFVNAVLRKESGSAISKEEFASAEAQYFPRSGDDQATIAQKTQNRQRAIEGMALSSGRAWNQYGPMSLNQQQQSQPDTVTQNGHTYTWNPRTGSYE